MRVLLVYEPVYGNTHRIADAVATGLRDRDGIEVEVTAAEEVADPDRFSAAISGRT